MTQTLAHNSTNASPNGLDPRWSRPAAGISLATAVTVIITMVVLAMRNPLAGTLVATAGLWLVMAVAWAASAYWLWRGRLWAQQVLLGLWAVILIVAVGYLLTAFVFPSATWWTQHPAARSPGIGLALVAMVAAAVTIGLLVVATPRNTRQRYGSMVAGAVAVALALAVAINVIAQHDYVRKSFESFGLYRLSDRNERILDQLDAPVRLTCLYNAADPQDALYGQRTYELLAEMATYAAKQGKTVEVVNANSDTGRRKTLDRLRERFSQEAETQIALLTDYVERSDRMVAALNTEADQWRDLPPNAYLSLWGSGESAAGALNRVAESIQLKRKDLARVLAIASGADTSDTVLPDYGQLANETAQLTAAARQVIAELGRRLNEFGRLPAAIAEHRDGINAERERLAQAQREMLDLVGKPGDPMPDNLSAAFDDFITQSSVVSQYARILAERLDDVAGPELTPTVAMARIWAITSEDLEGRPTRQNRPEVFRVIADDYDSVAYQLPSILAQVQDSQLPNRLTILRQQVAMLDTQLTHLSDTTDDVLDQFSTIDPTSQAILAQAATGAWMRDLRDTLDALLDQAESLPTLRNQDILPELSQNNIVLIEIGEQMRVVPFESVWPISGADYESDTDADGPQRLFNGNGAIGSALLNVSRDPFATVVVVYYATRTPAGVARSQVGPDMLALTAARLRQSNFRLRTWDLAGDEPPILHQNEQGRVVDALDLPVILLILPPPQAVIGADNMNEDRRAKVTRLIDQGTPTVFLTAHLLPERVKFPSGESTLAPVLYRWDQYLSEAWGIDAQTGKTLLPVTPDPQQAGQFLLDTARLAHLSLNLFTDHPIGQPLTGQRMLWSFLCPVVPAQTVPATVKLEPLLIVPGQWGNTMWITDRAMDLLIETRLAPQTTTVAPNFTTHETPLPTDGVPVAMAATRAAVGDRPESRLVVLGVGRGLMDTYLLTPPKHLDARGRQVPEELPHANPDVLINSLYWVIGQEAYIAAGPARAKPIGDMSTGMRNALWLICVLLLPAGILATGTAVMVARRR